MCLSLLGLLVVWPRPCRQWCLVKVGAMGALWDLLRAGLCQAQTVAGGVGCRPSLPGAV